jgi:hypothetical protein
MGAGMIVLSPGGPTPSHLAIAPETSPLPRDDSFPAPALTASVRPTQGEKLAFRGIEGDVSKEIRWLFQEMPSRLVFLQTGKSVG